MPDLLSRYHSMVSAGQIEADAAQLACVERLNTLVVQLGQKRLARKSNPLGWMFSRRSLGPASALKGLYIFGAVGRGKTMLMDLFFGFVPAQRKRRAHFHDFMADVHGRIHAFRQMSRTNGGKAMDPIRPVAQALAAEAWVLCFDEFTVNDIADAMILGRLFEALWEEGVVVIATSNVDPTELYKDGLNRALFLPFIEKLKTHMEVLRLDARTDYRLEKLAGAPVYHAPAGPAAEAALILSWRRLTGDVAVEPVTLAVGGRKLEVPVAASGVARFSFADLCARPLGASD
ncbi:MAG: cell division protein ZapE, partial [Beijerinckiaceae bacterium]